MLGAGRGGVRGGRSPTPGLAHRRRSGGQRGREHGHLDDFTVKSGHGLTDWDGHWGLISLEVRAAPAQ